MTKKKNPQTSFSQEESSQAQSLFAQYHQLAKNVRASTEGQQVETALVEINALTEGAQMALLKDLSRERHLDAADILVAINAFAELKDVRKEARRALIQLEGARIYPGWKPPLTTELEQLQISKISTNPPRFWKGLVTDSLETGEVQLMLFWEQGEDYREVRLLGFLLEFWHEGIKDFFTNLESKRSTENMVTNMATQAGIRLKGCSLDEGQNLLQKARAVNTEHGTKPHSDYLRQITLVNKLMPEIFSTAKSLPAVEKKVEEQIDLHGMHPLDIVTTFVESWADGDFSNAYDILTQNSPLRAGLSRDEWIAQRKDWANRFGPGDLVPALLYEREAPKPKIWLPLSLSRNAVPTTREVEAGWSIELAGAPLDNDTLPELPIAVTIHKASKRYWFWASYSLVQEDDAWHIESMIDEGARAQNLSVQEIRARLQELEQKIQKSSLKNDPSLVEKLDQEEIVQYMQEVIQPLGTSIYYADALIKKLPLEAAIYDDAANRSTLLSQFARSQVYLEEMIQRFPETRANSYQHLALVQKRLSEEYFDDEDDERAQQYLNLAEKSLYAALDLEDGFESHLDLVEIIMEDEERLDEAKTHLLLAKKLLTTPEQEAHVELHLGEIAQEQEQFPQALKHYQRVIELEPNSVDTWMLMGEVHQELEHFEEAESSYRRAIELQPDNPALYSKLGLFYKFQGKGEQAQGILKEGLRALPDSLELHLYLSGEYMSEGNFQQAEAFLEKAERIDPGSELIASYRSELARIQLERPLPTPKAKKLSGPQKKKSHQH